MRRGFTLIELLVVVGMLAVLMGALTTSVSGARTRAKIAKATQDVKEITNAILAFENIAKNHSLLSYQQPNWTKATEGALSMILGGETTQSGERSPVLYNAQITSGAIRDPWGNPYEFTIRVLTEESAYSESRSFVVAPILPNYWRLNDDEKQ